MKVLLVVNNRRASDPNRDESSPGDLFQTLDNAICLIDQPPLL